MPDAGTPQSRLEGARKQLRLAHEDLDDTGSPAADHAGTALEAVRRSLHTLDEEVSSSTADTLGPEIVECVACGRTGLPEQIHPTACPHTGGGGQ